jgi:NAD(P)H-dependent FMN reductase
MKKIIFLLGTARNGRQSQKAYNFVCECAKERKDFEPVFVDILDYSQNKTQGLSEDLTKQWSELVKSASGLVIISPEYNHGYPGELKMLLDNAYGEYEGKPVAICGVSNGPVGGARMAEQLKLVLSAFQMMIINFAVYFANITEIFDENGVINNKDVWTKKVNGMLDQLMRYAK